MLETKEALSMVGFFRGLNVQALSLITLSLPQEFHTELLNLEVCNSLVRIYVTPNANKKNTTKFRNSPFQNIRVTTS